MKDPKMEYRELMKEAAQIFNDRQVQHGDMRVTMDRIAQIATLISGIHLTPHDVALVLLSVKLARMGANRKNRDNYVDGINYFAFAGDLIDDDDDAEIAEFAKKYAPVDAPA